MNRMARLCLATLFALMTSLPARADFPDADTLRQSAGLAPDLVFLVFLTFYIPCVSTFAVMLKTLGRREALFSVALSVGVALGLAGATRLGAELLRLVV